MFIYPGDADKTDETRTEANDMAITHKQRDGCPPQSDGRTTGYRPAGIPNAYATLQWHGRRKRTRYATWVIASCPFCGERHEHGGGPGEGDPREHLGYREPHCRDLDARVSQYRLVEESTCAAEY